MKKVSHHIRKIAHGLKNSMDFSGIGNILQPGKILNDRELARAIRISIAAEHDAVHLYELIADCTSNALAKKVMQDVANEEKAHVGEFQKILSIIDPEDPKFFRDGVKEVEEMNLRS